ncbi:uncharacterized protein MYCFIDRAFT_172767 [Pseudocercospora fijiensis CIRAD86]|uniref:non-specific serine/threonine protein kinase n=1 Tax=Pseudocercospora fijiensis (strain CIRAD86) TaxID=383855 RepID=M3AR49_PSEFD|nr:uncharacterized protein MYCFIDRAFT_172767 [Pseudocercospora fijiensis CIRAD86]EME87101.1 hypothetical protein MYCFIDRAFT_172767 [Pseudocercospora fijiensis CIRAD86]
MATKRRADTPPAATSASTSTKKTRTARRSYHVADNSSGGHNPTTPRLQSPLNFLHECPWNIPTENNRIKHFDPVQISRDALQTHVIVHPKLQPLITAFLHYKQAHGSDIEKRLYADMSQHDLVARLITNRCLHFVQAHDYTVLRDGTILPYGHDEWMRVGTDAEDVNHHIFLEDYLSYDEMMLASMLGTSGPTHFINAGQRDSRAEIDPTVPHQDRGIIVGLVGARFDARGQMDHIICGLAQHWHGERLQDPELTKIFRKFFDPDYDEETFKEGDLNEKIYKGRIQLTIETALLEADDRAAAEGTTAHMFLPGLGLGVWRVSKIQIKWYFEALLDSLTWLDLKHVTTLECGWEKLTGWPKLEASLKAIGKERGINVLIGSQRPPCGKLETEELLVRIWAWDGNSLPGNEYWSGGSCLTSSDDPAAACNSTIVELHNPWVNPFERKVKVLLERERRSEEEHAASPAISTDFPTLEEIRAAIPAQGTDIKTLVSLFKPRTTGRVAEFIRLVKMRRRGRMRWMQEEQRELLAYYRLSYLVQRVKFWPDSGILKFMMECVRTSCLSQTAPTAAAQKAAWTEFNLDIWRPGRRPGGERGQNGKAEERPAAVVVGLNNVWTRFTAPERLNVYRIIQNYIATEAQLAALPAIPAQVPNRTATINTVQDYFRAISRRLEHEETLVEIATILINALPQKPVREKLVTHRNTLNATATQHRQSLGAIRDLETRCQEYARDIAPRAPPRGTDGDRDYGKVREYFDNHIPALRQRIQDRDGLRQDFDAAVNALSGDTRDVAVAQSRCLVAMRSEQDLTLTRLRATVEVLRYWLQNDPRDGEPHESTAPTAPLPDVDELERYIASLDDFKSFHDAVQRMNDFYDARLPGPPAPPPPGDVAETELATLFPIMEDAYGKHREWLERIPAHIRRLRDAFEAKWEDYDSLNEDEKIALKEFADKVVERRETMDAELGQGWMGPVFLGEGGHGIVSLWIKQDTAGRIVDRVTVKEATNYNENDNPSLGLWKAPYPISLEVAAMYKLKYLPGSDHIVRIRNFRTKPPVNGDKRHRIYAEYCKGGDLKAYQSIYHEPDEDPLSEPFLWALFDSLVSAGLLMEGHHLPKTTPPMWDEIVHGDMKANNILLADNPTGHFRGWQISKLSDFGLTMIIPATGIEPPDSWERRYSNWVAPEMTKVYNTTEEDGEAGVSGSLYPRSPANVWGAGFVMREMMHTNPWAGLWSRSQISSPGRRANSREDGWPKPPPSFTAVEDGRYSATLRDLVMKCLDIIPEKRPTFVDLRRAIIAETGPTGTDARLVNLRDAPADDPRFILHGPHRSVDNYAVGLAVDDLPADTLPFETRLPRPTADSANPEVVGGGTGEEAAVPTNVQDAMQYLKDTQSPTESSWSVPRSRWSTKHPCSAGFGIARETITWNPPSSESRAFREHFTFLTNQIMAAAAAAPTPLERWKDFNVDLWRAAQPRATSHGVRRGASNAWNAITVAEQANVITEVDRWTNVRAQLDITLMNPSPLPNAVPNTNDRNTLDDFFERGYDVCLSTRSLAASLDRIVNIVQHKSVRERVVPARDQAQTVAATWMAALGAMRGYTRRIRSFGDRSRIGPAGPTRAGPTPTYSEDRDYLDANRDALRDRRDNLQTLINDIRTEVQTRANSNAVVPRGERIYLNQYVTPMQRRIDLLTHIVAIRSRWDKDTDMIDDGARINDFGQEPSVNNLRDFIRHLDNIKGFEEALTRLTACYTSRFPTQPMVAGTDVEALFPSIVRCHQQHTLWQNATVPEVNRLQAMFSNQWGGDFDALSLDQRDRLRARAKEALRQREARNADLSSSWMGPMHLGAGMHGVASIWIKQDAAGRISDRVTVKDTNNSNPNYLNPSGVVQPPPRHPMEAVAMLRLVDLPGSSSVVNIRNWRRKRPFETSPGYRIYMEFCSGGDLQALSSNYWPRSLNPNFMPEPFLWAVFDSLVTAGLLMEGSHLRDAARPLWDQIIHGDMKPDNVFLGENTSGTFRGFPLAKLGDFGLATVFPKAGLDPQDNWIAFSGPGYRAPEMAKRYRRGNGAAGTYAPESAANVWVRYTSLPIAHSSILHNNPWANLWQGDEAATPHKPPGFTHPLELTNYSPRLRNLIMSCLEVQPIDRPTFSQLRQSILAEVGDDGADPNLARLRDAHPAIDARFTTGGPPRPADKYALGLATDDVLPAARYLPPPAVTSPVNVTVGGPPGAVASNAEFENNAVPELIRSVLSRKRTEGQDFAIRIRIFLSIQLTHSFALFRIIVHFSVIPNCEPPKIASFQVSIHNTHSSLSMTTHRRQHPTPSQIFPFPLPVKYLLVLEL